MTNQILAQTPPKLPTSHPFHAYLFVPANRPERIIKALTDTNISHKVHAIIIDLEDAVAGDDAHHVRHILGQCLTELTSQHHPSMPYIWVRIHGMTSPEFMVDTQFITSQPAVSGLVLPKAENAMQVSLAHELTNLPVIAMVESGQGILNIGQMARTKGVMALSYGCLDLLTSLSIARHSQAGQIMMEKVRCELALHSQANGLSAPIETIYPEFHDEDGFGRWVRHAYEFGFGGCLAIHPKQLATIANTGIRPDELDFAKKIVAHHEHTGEAIFAIDGQMVDLPVITWARRVLSN